jgi:hypothetical protein
MNIYEKVGDFIFNLVNLIVGGIIFAAIMSQETYPLWLYIVATAVAVGFFIFAIVLFNKSKKTNR